MIILLATLSNIFLTTPSQVVEEYPKIVAKHPEHLSIITGQTEGYLAYQVIAKAVYCTFHNKKSPGKKFLRYPEKNCPDLKQFFSRFSIVSKFDTTLRRVSDFLVAVSPCIQQKEPHESAHAIFLANNRKEEIKEQIRDIFRVEKVAPSIFEPYLNELIESCPRSTQGGMLTHIFLPQSCPIEKVLYPSLPFGIPTSEDSPTQFRFLPSGVTKENGFDPEKVPMYRYTLVKPAEFRAYKRHVKALVKKIFHEHKQDTVSLAKEQSIPRKVHKYLERNDWEKAHMLIEKHKLKDFYLPLITCFLNNHELERVEKVIPLLKKEEQHLQLVLLAFEYLIGYGNFSKFEEILPHLPEGEEKNFLLMTAIYLAEDKTRYSLTSTL